MSHSPSLIAFARTMDAMSIPALMLDREGRLNYTNQMLRDMQGRIYDQNALFVEEMVEPAIRDKAETILAEAWAGNATHLEAVLPTVNGHYIVLLWHFTLYPGEDGAPDLLGVVGHDHTARRSLERAIAESDSVLSNILDNSRDGIIIIDEHGTLLSFSKTAEKQFGYQAAEVLGRSVNMLMPMPYSRDHDSYIQNYLDTGNAKIIGRGREVPGRRKDGSTFPFRLNTTPPFKIGRSRCFLGIIGDLSQQKEVEDQLRRAQKMESIGTLAGGIAHDFNNILGGITGYVELMLEDAEEGSYLQEDLHEMLKACNRGKDLILQILTFSRQDKSERKPLYLHTIIKESLKLLRATIPTTIEICQQIDGNCPPILADPTQIHQVMMNLGTNAMHAMRQNGGTMTVRMERAQLDDEFHKTVNLPYGTYVHLSIIDTGIGMDAETKGRVFDPFFTTKAVGEGTGMGLSVVHGIVNSHGGGIYLETVKGVGTEFHLFFPTCREEIEEDVVSGRDISRGRGRILLVDDDALLLKVQGRILERMGYQVTSRSESSEALEAFVSDPHAFDLLITDQTMPRLTGTELATRVLQLRPELPIVLTTGYSEQITPERARELGVREFLLKPVSKAELGEALERILDT